MQQIISPFQRQGRQSNWHRFVHQDGGPQTKATVTRSDSLNWLISFLLSSVPRRRMVCPQWTAMSQHPASLLTTLPPKCHPTWGTAPPRRPMWPVPRGSRPVAVLYLPTAVISQPLWPSRAWQPTVTPSTRSLPRCCEVTSTDWWEKEWWKEGGGKGKWRGQETTSLSLVTSISFPPSPFYEGLGPRTHICAVLYVIHPPPSSNTQSDTRNEQSVHFYYKPVWKNWAGQVYWRTDTWLLLHPSTQFLSDFLLHTSANVFGQNWVMYNFMNMQSKKRGKKLCISVSGCLLIACFFMFVCFLLLLFMFLINVTVLWCIVFPLL